MRCGSFLIVVLIRQPAQGAARVPGRRRHGWHVRCTSFTGFWLYRSAGHLNSLITGFTYVRELAIFPPPDVCHPSASSDGTRSSKTEVTPRELGSSNARACPELHLACRASHHHHQPSRLLCAQGSETSTPHSTWAREKVRQRPLPSHTRPTHQELSLLALTLRSPFCFSVACLIPFSLLSWGGRSDRQSQPISSTSPTTFIVYTFRVLMVRPTHQITHRATLLLYTTAAGKQEL